MTAPIEAWRDDMYELTNGRWEIEIHYGSTLAKPADNPDGVKEGLFEAGVSMGIYHPGKTPLVTVFSLPFLTPSSAEDIIRLQQALFEHPAIKAELANWNARLLMNLIVQQYDMIGNKRIAKVEDLDGVRVRVSPLLGKPLKKFGAVQVMTTVGEIYTALETGTVDVAAFPLGIAPDFKFQEVSKYVTTELSMGSASQFIIVSQDAWDALPEEWKKLHNWWQPKQEMVLATQRQLKLFQAMPILRKAGLEIIEFPPEERAKIIAYAEETWDEWVKDMEEKGLPGREVFDYVVAKRKEITGK